MGQISQAALARSFPPVVGTAPRVLVLGSVPGQASLRAGQYYAHPRNQFWRVMQAVAGVDARADYAARCQALVAAGLALWDVIAECERPGSLDARIAAGSIRVNPIAALLAREPTIGCVACNGARAAAEFRRQVLPQLLGTVPPISVLALPSTSPAHAAVTLDAKIEAWSVLRQWLVRPPDRG